VPTDGRKRFFLFLVSSTIAAAGYEIARGSSLLMPFVTTRGMFVVSVLVIPLMLAATIGWICGIWQNDTVASLKVLSALWCLLLPPAALVFEIYYVCVIIHQCPI
jgi:hypothetical protein